MMSKTAHADPVVTTDLVKQHGLTPEEFDRIKKILGREPLLLRDWAKLHANELLEAAGS